MSGEERVSSCQEWHAAGRESQEVCPCGHYAVVHDFDGCHRCRVSGYTVQANEPANATLDADYLRRVHVVLDGCCAACGPCLFPTTTAAAYGPCEGFPCPTLKALDGAS